MSGGILVVGFGPFGAVYDNPAARLARALDGAAVDHPSGPIPVLGGVIRVTWWGCIEDTLRLAEGFTPAAILGVGVATLRSGLEVERVGRRFVSDVNPDNDGVHLTDLEQDGPVERRATIAVESFAESLGATVSDDAGGYVCNAWLYQAVGAFSVPVGFLHVPSGGADPARVLSALRVLV